MLDWITHRPDLPIAPGYPLKVGLGLWNSVPATLLVEGAMFAAGVWVYARGTRGRDRMGRINFRVYVIVLGSMYVGNAFSPPPPDPHTLAVFALGIWLLPAWAVWVDRHRTATM